MLSVLRFTAQAQIEDVNELVEVLRARAGCVSVEAGQAVEDPDVWVVLSRWADLGSCRRGLGSREVRMLGSALLGGVDRAPSVFAPLGVDPLNDPFLRGEVPAASQRFEVRGEL